MKKKLLVLALAVVLCFSLAACGEKEPFITLDSTEITVNAEGIFQITGTADRGTTVEVGGATPTMNYGDDNTFTASVQMNDPVDQAVLTATYMTDTLEFNLTFDTTAYVEALDAAQAQKEAEQAAAQAQEEETNALKALEGTPLTEAMDAIQEYGYTASYFDGGEDFTDFIEDMADLYIVDTLDVDAENKAVKVNLISKSTIESQKEEEALSKKLEVGYAWVAVENYGESMYPYGFKLHSILGRIAEEPKDENTWFLKATCDVTNIYGAKGEFTCEAEVTGTTENPEVISFIVY